MLSPRPFRTPLSAFTLIELLIVVAIIAILATIAVPNFLEAQVRAKVSRALADMRTMGTALEAYVVDQSAYPQAEINGTLKYLWHLSTPVAYCTSADFDDPFTPNNAPFDIRSIPTLRYYGFNDVGIINTAAATHRLISPRSDDEDLRIAWYIVFCHAPNGVRDSLTVGGSTGTFVREAVMQDPALFVCYMYDPTNGTVSPGEIFRSGGSPIGDTAAVARFVTGHQ